MTMPNYDFICTNCQKPHEAFQKMLDEPLKICPHCGKESLKRKIGMGSALLFKGSGFYITDYGPRKPKESPKESPSEKSKKPETSS